MELTFRETLQRGLGRCYTLMEDSIKNNNGVEKYREDIIWGLKNRLAYDPQSEGVRSLQLYELISFFEDKSDFFDIMEKCINGKTDSEIFQRCCEILAFFSCDGYEDAKKILKESYITLYNKLLRKRKMTIPFIEGENFEFLCLSLVTHSKNISESIKIYFDIARDIGKLYIKNKLFSDYLFYWFEDEAKEKIGEKRLLDIMERERQSDDELTAYINSFKSNEDMSKNKNDREIKAEEIYEELKKGGDSVDFFRMYFVRFVKIGNTEEIEKLAEYYYIEKDENVRISILKLFSLCRGDAAKYLNKEKLFNDAKSENRELKNSALEVLTYIKGRDVRRFALGYKRNKESIPYIIGMLAKNYNDKDREIFIGMVKSVYVSYDSDSHWVFRNIIKMFEDKSIRRPPKEILYYIYENELCPCCRFSLVRIMIRRHIVDESILRECLYDCNDDIRDYAKKIIKKRKMKK